MTSGIEDTNYLENNEIDILSLYTGNKDEYLQNGEALERLKEEQAILLKTCGISLALSLVGLVISPPVLLGLSVLLSANVSLEYFTRVARLYETMKVLLEHFGDEGIKITPRVKTEEGIIDLFVKLPDKRAFALMLRSNGDSQVKWREDRQDFFVSQSKKGKKAIRKWSEVVGEGQKADRVIMTLKRQKNQILGTSTNERNKPVVKAIVLTGKTRIDANNDPALFVDFGRARVLRVHAGVVTYVLSNDDLINFLTPSE
jgi:hypothetical protein